MEVGLALVSLARGEDALGIEFGAKNSTKQNKFSIVIIVGPLLRDASHGSVH